MEKNLDKTNDANEQNKFREPFRPEDTPTPPQVMDPSVPPESGVKTKESHTDRKKDTRKKPEEKRLRK